MTKDFDVVVWISGLEIQAIGRVEIVRRDDSTDVKWKFMSRTISDGTGTIDATKLLTWRVHNNGEMLGQLIEDMILEELKL